MFHLHANICKHKYAEAPLNMQGAPPLCTTKLATDVVLQNIALISVATSYVCCVCTSKACFGPDSPVMKWQEQCVSVLLCVCVCMFCFEGTAEMCGLSRPLRLYNIYQPWPAVSFKTDFLFLCNVCHLWRGAAEHLVILMLIGAVFTEENIHFVPLWII